MTEIPQTEKEKLVEYSKKFGVLLNFHKLIFQNTQNSRKATLLWSITIVWLQKLVGRLYFLSDLA